MKLKNKFFIPSLGDMLFLSIFLYLCLSRGAQMLGDGDTGYHIRAGEWILENSSIPRFDMFSFHIPPLPWTAHEWLSEVIMALIHRVSGLTGIVVFFTFLLALTSYLLFKWIRSREGNILTTVGVVLLATAASQIHWLARPHVFSLLLFFLWFSILDDYRNGVRNRLILLPLIMLLWVNLHGGYVSGFLLIGIFIAGEIPGLFSKEVEIRVPARQRLTAFLITTAVCLPIACINPYGYHILLFPFNLVSNKLIMDNVLEFLSPNFHEPNPFKYLLMLLIAILALSRERLRCTELLLILVFLSMSLYSVRYITLFAIIVAPLLVRQADILLGESSGLLAAALKNRSRNIAAIDVEAGGIMWPILSVLLVCSAVASGVVHYEFNPATKPITAVRFLQKVSLQGNMFNNDEFGDYLIYSSWPRYKVFFDGRSDMYGSGRLKEYMKIRSFEVGWEKILDKYGITWIFIEANAPLTRFLRERDDWELIYQDTVASIFVKTEHYNRENIDKIKKIADKWQKETVVQKY